MYLHTSLRTLAGASLATAALAVLPVSAGAAPGPSGEQRETERVRIQDDCERRSFNAAVGPGTCVGDGRTTFDRFVAQLREERRAGAWSFQPRRLTIERGQRVRAVNEGGETHSFTRVRAFGPGCVPEINRLLGFPRGSLAPECAQPGVLRTLAPVGESVLVGGLGLGRHRFACLIHPWMRTTVLVEPQ